MPTCSPSRAQGADPACSQGCGATPRRVATAAPVWYELLFGASVHACLAETSEIEAYLFGIVARNVPILPYDEACAEWHSGEGARLRALGRPSLYADGQVAANRTGQRLVLVTANVKHFSQFLGLVGRRLAQAVTRAGGAAKERT
jgi:predicted nucleic acid-binding protein